MAEDEGGEEGGEEKKEGGDEGGEKKKKKPLLLIIIGAVVLLGGGAGAFLFLSGGGGEGGDAAKPASAEVDAEGEDAEGEANEGEGAEGETKEGEGAEGEANEGEGAEGEAKEGEGAEGEAKEGEYNFGQTITMKPFNLNLGNPLENRYVRMQISIEFRGGDSQKTELEARMPQLRDAIITITSRKTMEFLLGPDGKDQLRLELLNRINQYMDQKIEAVYITDILIE